MRLSALATNVLNLSRIENQTILGPKSLFNLSEQIRSCILLLERKWNAKHLDLSLGFEEYEIEADPELLKEVWINLLTTRLNLRRSMDDPGDNPDRLGKHPGGCLEYRQHHPA